LQTCAGFFVPSPQTYPEMVESDHGANMHTPPEPTLIVTIGRIKPGLAGQEKSIEALLLPGSTPKPNIAISV
jgi:hypothetical protein